MREVKDKALLQKYIEQSDFAAQFSFPVSELARLYFASAGEDILREGEPDIATLYYLAKGRAKLRASLPNGKASLLDFPKAPCFIGEMELLGIRGETLEVRALEQCWLLALPVRECRERLLSDCIFLRSMCRYLGEKEFRKTVAITRAQGYPLVNRLADFVITASSGGFYREKNIDASEYLGVSYRHLQQVLGDFVSMGYLERAERGYRIANAAALGSLAGEMIPQG